jgi:hypothetical protein
MKTYEGGDIAPCILDEVMVSFTPRPFYADKKTPIPIRQEAGLGPKAGLDAVAK